jgi:WD40 repeat protein
MLAQSHPEHKDASGDPLPAGATMRFGSARWWVRPQNLSFSPQSIAFSPDGQSIFTANQFDGVRALDVETGRELYQVTLQWPSEQEGLFRPMMPVINFAFSKDCKTLASIQRHLQKVRLWEVSSGKLIREFRVPGFDAQSLEWSLAGSKMVMREYPAGPRPGGLRVWDLVKKAEVKLVDGAAGNGGLTGERSPVTQGPSWARSAKKPRDYGI